jgi:uncharacterized protein YtpQ (UPF0354 family)
MIDIFYRLLGVFSFNHKSRQKINKMLFCNVTVNTSYYYAFDLIARRSYLWKKSWRHFNVT